MGLLTLTVSFRRLSGSSFLAQVISSLKPLLSIGCLVCLKYGAGLSLFPWGQVCSHNQSARTPYRMRVCVCVYVHKVAFSGEECAAPGRRDALLCLCIFKCASIVSRVFSSLLLRQACSATATRALEDDRL